MKNGTLKFFRKFYQIPKKQKLCWCLLEQMGVDAHPELRLGIMLPGTNKAIDVAARRFIQLCGCALVRYRAYPAKRRAVAGGYEYVCDSLKITKPKHYVQDLYFACVYSNELMSAEM